MATYTPRVKEILKENGFVYLRPGKGDHEIWINPETKKRATVDGKIKSKNFAIDVLKNAGININKRSF